MSKKFDKKPLAIAIGTAMAGSLSAIPAADADNNPFGMSELSSGYMQVAEADTEMKCGEGKCGSNKMKEQMKKGGEGKCAGMKSTESEKKADGKCGAMMNKEEKSKEGKCGGAKTTEAKCGAMMEKKAAEEKK